MIKSDFYTVKYDGERLTILDQTLLPGEERYAELKTAEDVYEAIKGLRVRGAPAIGVAAAYGLYVAVRDYEPEGRGAVGTIEFMVRVGKVREYLADARPTAVDLLHALDRVYNAMADGMVKGRDKSLDQAKDELLAEARRIEAEQIQASDAMGAYGLELLEPGMGILTHCNAGALATVGTGTCLAPIYLGNKRGYNFKVYADETRPLLQGARLTAWELLRAGVDVTLNCDNMASVLMKSGRIDAVVVGCDRMAANGDGANKIGTSGMAVLAHEYGIPFYMFAPMSTIDMNAASGDDITIEMRAGEEVKEMWYSKPMAPAEVKVFNPAFDVTEHKYITAVVTDRGIVRPPYIKTLKQLTTDGDVKAKV